MAAVRSIVSTLARRAGPAAMRPAFRPAVAPMKNFAPALGLGASRTYVTVEKFTRTEAKDRLENFEAEVMSANWGDYAVLVYNGPFYEAEFEKVMRCCEPYLGDTEMGATMSRVQEMMDVLYVCEDIRDHINELCELCTRASGLMGTGYGAEAKVENLGEHAEHCAQAYDDVLKKHPNFKPKIEQTIGHGLAVLRQKHKFNWTTRHRYFF